MENRTQKNFFQSNIRFLRKRSLMGQEELAGKLGMTRSRLAALEAGNTKAPQPEDYLNFSEYFRISVDTLLKVDLTKLGELKIRELESGNDVYIKGGNLRVVAITVDRSNNENIEFVPVKAKAGYAAGGFSDPEYIAALPKFSMPEVPSNGTYRIFPITGDSMLPIPDKSLVTATFIADWTGIKPGTPCIIVLRSEQDVVFKLVTLNTDGTALLESLNRAYKPYSVNLDDIVEIWQFHSFSTRQIPAVSGTLDMLLAEIRDLKQTVSQKLQHVHT